jgi:hypothetical protein
LTDQSSSNLAFLNINFDMKHGLHLMVDTYIKLYTTKSELPTDNPETNEIPKKLINGLCLTWKKSYKMLWTT